MKPPRTWWSQTWKQVASWHPGNKAEVTKIVSKIWQELPPELQESLALGNRSIKTTEVSCPKCQATNPVSKINVVLKCRKCGKSLVAVRVRRRQV